MKYLAIYDKDETEYNTQRLGFLENAEDVCISQSINGDYTLEFSLPKGDEKRELIAYERKVGLGDKIFRIKTIDGLKVTAVSLMQDACRHHIQYIEDMIGEKAYKIFNKIFSGCPYVEVLSDDEYDELGLEKVDNLIDFFEQSKKTPIGCLKLLMETLNKYKVHSEIYINNNKIGLVKRLGKDRGVVIDTRFNACEITPKIDSYSVVTKLFPYGKDDLPLEKAAYKMDDSGNVCEIALSDEDKRLGRRGYILSPNYDRLGSYEAFCEFSEIDDQNELLEAAKHQFSQDNIERIDVPKYSLDIKVIDIKGEVKLGDTVTVNDTLNGIKKKHRVISTKVYPYEPHRNSITVGVPSISQKELFDGIFSATQYLRINKNGAADELKTSSLEFMKSNTDVTVENDGAFQKIAQYETGAMFVSPNEKYAVAIIDGKIKIGVKDKSQADGWEWIGVFGHGDNEKQTYLYTNLVTIMSENGELKIEGNLIQMFDSSGVLRFHAGYNESLSKYVFELYDKEGNKNMYIDDDGNLTMRGVLKTGLDNEARTVIDKNGIRSYNKGGGADGLWANFTESETDGVHTIALYDNGEALFKVFKGTAGTHISLGGEIFLISDGSTVKFGQTLMYCGSEVANKADIEKLQSQINAMKSSGTINLG